MNMKVLGPAALLLTMLAPVASHADESPTAIVEHMHAVYAALSSYSDSGTLIYEYGGRDEHHFTTAFNRSPRHLLLDVRKQGGDRIVITADPDAFHTWWKATGVAADYPNPNNLNAIRGPDYPTRGISTRIPSLLYSKAGIPSVFTNFVPQRDAGIEPCGDRKCHRLEGESSDYYAATGKKVNVRKVTMWIEVDSYLVRKLIEEPDHPPGQVDRVTTIFVPQANPKVPDDAFKFTPPK